MVKVHDNLSFVMSGVHLRLRDTCAMIKIMIGRYL